MVLMNLKENILIKELTNITRHLYDRTYRSRIIIYFVYGNSICNTNMVINEMEKVNICQTVHTSSLNEVFFETVEHMDCFYDPMSIYR